jgi:nicotine blue oxidoreductase
MTSGLILAAGASSRMGRPKALLTIDGETFANRLIRVFEAAGCAPVRIVVGADASALVPRLGEIAIVAADWADGMRASLRAGLRALPPGPVILTHVDRPLVRVETVRAVVGAVGPAIAHHAGQPGHPVRLSEALCARLMDPDDTRLDHVLADWSPVAVEVDDPAVLHNINTPADYAALI